MREPDVVDFIELESKTLAEMLGSNAFAVTSVNPERTMAVISAFYTENQGRYVLIAKNVDNWQAEAVSCPANIAGAVISAFGCKMTYTKILKCNPDITGLLKDYKPTNKFLNSTLEEFLAI